jgi:hypothetical protein
MAAAGSALLVPLMVSTAPAQSAPSTAHPAFGTIAVANFDANGLLKFAPGSTGNASPTANIVGAATGLSGPAGVGFDRRGRLYAANFSGASITAYGRNATGNATPELTISGSNTTLKQPIGLAVTPGGDIWVANLGNSDILEFAAGDGGNVAPTRTISGPATGLSTIIGLALTPDGKGVWVTDQGAAGSAVEREFSTAADGDAAPISTIGGGSTQLDTPYGVAAALDGSVVFSNEMSEPPAVLTFGPHARGDVTPRSVISGSNTGLDTPALIGLNPGGEIWVANFGGSGPGSLTRYPSHASGNAAPDHAISGSNTQLDRPEGVVVYMQQPTAPRSLKKHMHGKTLTLRWHRPASNGGGLEGYVVRHAKHKSGKFHTVKTTKKRHYTKHHAAHGYYDVLAFNQAGYSSHSRRVHVS